MSTMQKVIFFFLSIFVYFSFFGFADASVVINEVMYDLEGTDTGREWIEVYNTSDNEVDLSLFKFFEANVNHSIFWGSGSKTIQGKDYAVIVSDINKFKIDWPSYSGSIFDSSFSLNNEGENLAIKNSDLEILDEYNYNTSLGATGDGKSLQKVSSSWQASTPTPGKANSVSGGEEQPESNTEESDSNTNTSTSSLQSSSNSEGYKKIQTKISAKSFGFVGLANNLEASVLGREGEALFYGRYFWNFGDGSSKEMKVNTGGSVTHTYFYPGEYRVILEYYINDYGEIPDATDEIILKIIPADVLISGVGDEKDFFIEITNNTANEVDISKWMLVSNDKRFVFPKNSKIASKKKVIFSPFVTGFTSADKSNLKLVNADWKTVFDYGLSIAPVPALTPTKNVSSIPRVILANNNVQDFVDDFYVEDQNNTDEAFSESIDTNSSNINLDASVIKSDVKSNYLIYLFLILIIFIGGGMVYFLRKIKTIKSKTEDGDDFDILDE